jgi:hypothetical protein
MAGNLLILGTPEENRIEISVSPTLQRSLWQCSFWQYSLVTLFSLNVQQDLIGKLTFGEIATAQYTGDLV